MFWKKKEQVPVAPARPISVASTTASSPPKPILKSAPEDNGAGSPSIRFAGSRGATQSASSARPISTASTVTPGLPVTPMSAGRSGPHSHLAYTPTASPATSSSTSPAPAVEPLRRPPPIHTQFPASSPAASPASSSSSSSSRNPVQRTAASGGRRSSRPTSPAVSSFGARVRVLQDAAAAAAAAGSSSTGSAALYQQPMMTPPPSVALAAASGRTNSSAPSVPSGICTPPTAYGPTAMIRAPPSPYRATTTASSGSSRRPSVSAIERRMSLERREDLGPRPPRVSSLYEASQASATVASGAGPRPFPGGQTVPMLNIIPATPQELGESFEPVGTRPVYRRPKRRSSHSSLAEAVNIDTGRSQPDEAATPVPSQDQGCKTPTPAIEVKLEFSPFEPEIALPSVSPSSSCASVTLQNAAQVAEPTLRSNSPPVKSSARTEAHAAPSAPSSSLPSLVSHGSITTSSSSESVRFEYDFDEHDREDDEVDVQEAIGNMLASLSESMPSLTSVHSISSDLDTPTLAKPQGGFMPLPPAPIAEASNPGLGLGLDLPLQASITAPLVVSPKKKKQRPPPLDLSRAKTERGPGQESQTAPPCINHRRPFYGTAKAHPRSPSSGVFYHSQNDDGIDSGRSSRSSSLRSLASSASSSLSSQVDSDDAYGGLAGPDTLTHVRGHRSTLSRDSISLTSEASDDDLHTASIVLLVKPAVRERAIVHQHLAEEVLGEEVGVAL